MAIAGLPLNTEESDLRKLILSYVTLVVLPLSASTIPVGNSSFEDSAPGFGDPTGWTLFSSTTSPTFTDNVRIVVNNGSAYPVLGGVAGSQFAAVNLDHNFLSPSHPTIIVPPDGSLDGLVSGDLGTFAANMIYTLTADIGLSQALSSLDAGLALGTGAPTLADVFPAPGSTGFASVLINASQLPDTALQPETITLNTSLHPGLDGKTINVSLLFHSEYMFGRQALFDDVTLSATPSVPESPTRVLFAIAGLLWLLRHAAVRFAGLRRASPGPSL
jgi:hypothetical protein